MEKVLVAGATGPLGAEVVKGLKGRGAAVRARVRRRAYGGRAGVLRRRAGCLHAARDRRTRLPRLGEEAEDHARPRGPHARGAQAGPPLRPEALRAVRLRRGRRHGRCRRAARRHAQARRLFSPTRGTRRQRAAARRLTPASVNSTTPHLTALERHAHAHTWERGHPCPPERRKARMIERADARWRAGMPALPGDSKLK